MPKYYDSPSVREQLNGTFAAALRRQKIEARLYPLKKKSKSTGKSPPERFVPPHPGRS